MEPAIVASDLGVGYGAEPVLRGIDFELPRGGILAILGPSGSGKSTLLKAVFGQLRPMSGRLRVLGHEIEDGMDEDDLHRVRRRLGVLFQSGGLLGSLTVEENVALPIEEFTDLPRPLVRELVQLKLGQVELSGAGDLMPAELSGGMAKRVAVARTIALDPEVLLCDEPTSGLDPATALTIDRLLLDLNRSLGITLVVVTHDLATIENLGGTCILLDAEDGTVVAIGSAAEIRSRTDDARVATFFARRLEEATT